MMKKLLLAGNTPYVAVLLLCGAFFALGQRFDLKPSRIAVADKGAIILSAALDRPNASAASLESDVVEPIKATLQKYLSAGYLVIDTSRDEAGNMTLVAIPPDVVDISDELRAAVERTNPYHATSKF